MNSLRLIIAVKNSEQENSKAFHELFLCENTGAKQIAIIPQVGYEALKKANAIERINIEKIFSQGEDQTIFSERIYSYYEVLPQIHELSKAEKAGPRLLAALEEIVTTGYYNEDSGSKARRLISELK